MATHLRIVGAWMKVTNPKRIKTRRERLGYSQVDLAALVGCSQQYISLLETGSDDDCSEAIARKIAKRLDIDLEEAFEERTIYGEPAKASSTHANKKRAA